MGEAKRKRETAATLGKIADQIWQKIEASTTERAALLSMVLERAIAADPDLNPETKAAMIAELLSDNAGTSVTAVARQALGDAPVEERYRAQMEHLARALDRYFNDDKRGEERETGFVMLVFPFGDRAGRCNFISNGADRANIVSLFREMIARFEGATLVETPGRA
ncbi:MAG TPA: hypothetical protein VGF07_13240 [Stellaceae bacterium]|jgi:hypothetical protein